LSCEDFALVLFLAAIVRWLGFLVTGEFFFLAGISFNLVELEKK